MPGRNSICVAESRAPATGTNGTNGVLNRRGKSGRFLRRITTLTHTIVNANKVPIDTSLLSMLAENNPVNTAAGGLAWLFAPASCAAEITIAVCGHFSPLGVWLTVPSTFGPILVLLVQQVCGSNSSAERTLGPQPRMRVKIRIFSDEFAIQYSLGAKPHKR
jgi:hypothetical protein